MSLKISSSLPGTRVSSGNQPVKLRPSEGDDGRISGKKSDRATSFGSSTTSSERLRYEISSLNRKSVEIQESVQESQSTELILEDFGRALNELRDKPSLETLQNVKELIHQNPKVFRGQPNRSSNDRVEPVTISRPPKVGAYSIEIFTGQTRHPESVSYTIKLVDEEGTQKTVTASVSPANGLIEGVELYFETDADSIPAVAQLEIKDDESKNLKVPSFEKDIQRLETALNDQAAFDKHLQQTNRKLDSVRQGIHSELRQAHQSFLTLNSTQENLRAMESDFLSVSSAFDALDDVKNDLKKFSSADQLYRNHDPSKTKSLLE